MHHPRRLHVPRYRATAALAARVVALLSVVAVLVPDGGRFSHVASASAAAETSGAGDSAPALASVYPSSAPASWDPGPQFPPPLRAGSGVVTVHGLAFPVPAAGAAQTALCLFDGHLPSPIPTNLRGTMVTEAVVHNATTMQCPVPPFCATCSPGSTSRLSMRVSFDRVAVTTTSLTFAFYFAPRVRIDQPAFPVDYASSGSSVAPEDDALGSARAPFSIELIDNIPDVSGTVMCMLNDHMVPAILHDDTYPQRIVCNFPALASRFPIAADAHYASWPLLLAINGIMFEGVGRDLTMYDSVAVTRVEPSSGYYSVETELTVFGSNLSFFPGCHPMVRVGDVPGEYDPPLSTSGEAMFGTALPLDSAEDPHIAETLPVVVSLNGVNFSAPSLDAVFTYAHSEYLSTPLYDCHTGWCNSESTYTPAGCDCLVGWGGDHCRDNVQDAHAGLAELSRSDDFMCFMRGNAVALISSAYLVVGITINTLVGVVLALIVLPLPYNIRTAVRKGIARLDVKMSLKPVHPSKASGATDAGRGADAASASDTSSRPGASAGELRSRSHKGVHGSASDNGSDREHTDDVEARFALPDGSHVVRRMPRTYIGGFATIALVAGFVTQATSMLQGMYDPSSSPTVVSSQEAVGTALVPFTARFGFPCEVPASGNEWQHNCSTVRVTARFGAEDSFGGIEELDCAIPTDASEDSPPRVSCLCLYLPYASGRSCQVQVTSTRLVRSDVTATTDESGNGMLGVWLWFASPPELAARRHGSTSVTGSKWFPAYVIMAIDALYTAPSAYLAAASSITRGAGQSSIPDDEIDFTDAAQLPAFVYPDMVDTRACGLFGSLSLSGKPFLSQPEFGYWSASTGSSVDHEAARDAGCQFYGTAVQDGLPGRSRHVDPNWAANLNVTAVLSATGITVTSVGDSTVYSGMQFSSTELAGAEGTGYDSPPLNAASGSVGVAIHLEPENTAIHHLERATLTSTALKVLGLAGSLIGVHGLVRRALTMLANWLDKIRLVLAAGVCAKCCGGGKQQQQRSAVALTSTSQVGRTTSGRVPLLHSTDEVDFAA